jgi:hypothetical protein
MKPWIWAAGGVAGVGGVVVYHKKKAAASANAQQQNQSQTQAAPITTIPYAVGLNYGNGYSGGGRHGATGATGPAGPAGPAGTTATTAIATATTGTTGTTTGTTGSTGTHRHLFPVFGGFLGSHAPTGTGTLPAWGLGPAISGSLPAIFKGIPSA